MKSSAGFITVDYLFAFFLVAGFSLVVMTFSATLSMTEVVQYMTFSAARNYFAGNVSEVKQKEAAARKFSELKSNPVVSPLLSGSWFSVPDTSVIIDFNIPTKYPAFQSYGPESQINLFHGVVVTFNARILDFQIPFFGSTKKSGADESTGFSTYISSFLGREPTFEECNSFNQRRWEGIKQLANSVGATGYNALPGTDDYVVINDNGC